MSPEEDHVPVVKAATATGCSQQRRHSGSQHRARSSQWVENQVRSSSPDHLQLHYQDERARSPDHTQGLPHRRVSFCMPEGEDMTAVKEPVTVKSTTEDLETWLEHQVGQLGTPTWWRELEAVPDIENPRKFARKIWASFYVPEV